MIPFVKTFKSYAHWRNPTASDHLESEFLPLTQVESSENLLETQEASPARNADGACGHSLSFWVFFACGVSFACTIANVYSTASHILHSKIAAIPEPRFITPYFGLSRAGNGPPLQLENFPKVVAQVNRSNPSFVYPVNGRAPKDELFGARDRLERRFLVDEEVSTIVQFRVKDFNIEMCQIKFRLPTQNDLLVGQQNLTYGLEPSAATINVWELSSPHALDLKRLSWDSKPERKSLMWSFNATEGCNKESHSFRRSSGSLVTLEFACDMSVQDRCRVEFWQTVLIPELAVLLAQRTEVANDAET